MSDFQSAIELAFKSAVVEANVLTGPFGVRLSLDQWANNQEILFSFPSFSSDLAEPFDFKAAIVGNDHFPEDLRPSDTSRFALHEDETFLVMWLPAPDGVLYIWNFKTCVGVMCCTTERMPAWLLSRPMLPLLHSYASNTDWCPIHAAAVGRNGKFLLMVGPGGAGKSTAALACVAAGWQYAGDDFVMINPTLRLVMPLYASGRMRLGGTDELAGKLSRYIFAKSCEGEEQRYELRFGRQGISSLVEGGAIKRILIPRRLGGTAFEVQLARPADTFASIIPYTRIYTPGRAKQLTKKLLFAAGMVPAHFLETGREIMSIPSGLQKLLNDAL